MRQRLRYRGLSGSTSVAPREPGLAGNTRRARDILRQLEDLARTTFVSPYHVAYVHTGLGDVDKALDLLERAAATRAGPLYSLGSSFLLAPLRDHPRFRAFART